MRNAHVILNAFPNTNAHVTSTAILPLTRQKKGLSQNES